MKTYEAIYEPKKTKGVYGISLVENPAMEGLFIALSEPTEIQLKEVDKEQRILMGLILEPNKPVYRNQDGEQFNIVFSEDTVKELSHGFFKHNNHSNSKIEHTGGNIDGVTFVESWIVENPKIDKSANFGFSYPKGSWIATMKIDNDEIWNDYIKTGKVQGFSVDAMINLREINLKSEIIMSTDKTIADAITNGFNQFLAHFKKEDVKVEFGEIKTEDGNVTIMFDGETMEVGGKVWIIAEDKTEVPLPVGSYKLDGGQVLVVAEEGIIAEVKATEEAPSPEQAPAEMTAKETDATAKAIENAIKSIMIKYSEDNVKRLDDMEAKFTSHVTNLTTDYEAKIVALSNQPAAKPFKSAPEQKEVTGNKRQFSNLVNKLNS